MTTNYERLLGTPERAAEALSDAGTCWGTLTGEIACGHPCEGRCPMWELEGGAERCLSERPEKWREWLEGEAEPLLEACNAVMEEFPNTMRMLEES